MKRIAGALVALLAASCQGDRNPTTPTPAPAPAPVPLPDPAVVEFLGDPQRVREGGAVQFRIAWERGGQEGAIPLAVTALAGGDASAADYTLSPERLEIPAGAEPTGELTLEVATLEDGLIEANETLRLSVEAPPGFRVWARNAAELVIVDVGEGLCAGVRLSVGQPVRNDLAEGRLPVRTETATVRLALDIVDPIAADLALDWTGPYRYVQRFEEEDENPVDDFDVNVVDWSFETTATGVRHHLEFEWMSHLFAGFRLRSEAACKGAPQLICTGLGCSLFR